MTAQQIATLRKLHSARKVAQNAYHACLASNAPAAERHAAEKACSAAMAAIERFTSTL